MNEALPLIAGRQLRRIHCVGAGGMGLGPLAIFLSGLGFSVSGEDDAPGGAMRLQLEKAGVRIGAMDAACECLVVSSAIPPGHPAAQAAARLGIPLLRRGEALACAVSSRKLVAVCGSHGKTTTTAMLIEILRRSGRRVGYVLGGLFDDKNLPPASVGSEEWVVAEIDESDGTIREFSPELTVLVNLDWDHPDHYRTRSESDAAFTALLARTRQAVLVSSVCGDSLRIASSASRSFSFGGPDADFSSVVAAEDDSGVSLVLGGRFPALRTQVRARGSFNASNATAALAAATLMGLDLSGSPLAEYPGVRRRQSNVEASESFAVVEDYAHHPAEIGALLASLRTRAGQGRLVVVFQPHRFSRTAHFRTGFARALSLADRVHLLDVYAAGEAALAGGSSQDLAAEFSTTVPLACHGEDARACFVAASEGLGTGDLLAVVGAGDVDQKARAWLEGRRWDRWVDSVRTLLPAGEKLLREECLGPRTTMRVGGCARAFAEPSSVEALGVLLAQAAEAGLKIFILGRGSNLLVPDEGVDGLVLSLSHPNWAGYERLPDGKLRVGAGLRLKNLCGLAARDGLSGLEFLEGIPGNLGGALRMNAGAMGGWIFDVVESVQVFHRDGRVEDLPAAAMGASYRTCRVLDESIALSAVLRVPDAKGSAEITARIEEYRRKRQVSQPREPSAGCIFKNPEGNSAGRLIDECGLKGERIGDAQVSPIHANFIVNLGAASASDVLALVRRVRARVREQRGVELEPEVLLFGGDWHSVL